MTDDQKLVDLMNGRTVGDLMEFAEIILLTALSHADDIEDALSVLSRINQTLVLDIIESFGEREAVH